jgi:hypothetical protein
VAETIGTNAFYTGGRGSAGVHLLLRLSPPHSRLDGFEPEYLLVGHGAGIRGPEAAAALHDALRTSRSGLLHVASSVPRLILDARRRRRG